ncbi:hypothetical protein Nepgr_010508 [Nepenthes gracilis]|uniref:Ribosomal protein S6 n=1 Tax=Nepenthes gracilis TaxID=150966 RepID=A0AAD3XL39_NEPGR|nr:hypothetical protein Nepgr_010508 [Nepenthes gracilis]
METLLRIPTTADAFHPFVSTSRHSSVDRIRCLIGRYGNQSFSPTSLSITGTSRRKSLVVQAKNTGNKNKKVDNHRFIPRLDEATGPFPEAVLLKERKVQEDGKLLPEFADAEERELFEYLNFQLESASKVEQMRHYEVVYLIHEDQKDEVDSVNSKIQDFLREKKGKVWRFSDWGLRRLAYKIKKATHAHYILMNFELEAKWINDFKSMLDHDDRVIRHLVIKRDERITEDCPPPPEIHTLKDGMDDDYDGEDAESWDDEDDLDLEGYDSVEDGLTLVDSYDDDGDDGDDSEVKNYQTARMNQTGKKNPNTPKVVR